MGSVPSHNPKLTQDKLPYGAKCALDGVLLRLVGSSTLSAGSTVIEHRRTWIVCEETSAFAIAHLPLIRVPFHTELVPGRITTFVHGVDVIEYPETPATQKDIDWWIEEALECASSLRED